MPVLYGVFLYMGIASLSGNQVRVRVRVRAGVRVRVGVGVVWGSPH